MNASNEIPIGASRSSGDSEYSSDGDGSVMLDELMTQIVTADEMMNTGLLYARFTKARIDRCKRDTNVKRFVSHFGSIPEVVVLIFEDLQLTDIDEARLDPKDVNLKFFLMALHFLKCYPTENEREAMFDISPKWGREKVWLYVQKIQALKAEAINWPQDNFTNDIWIMTVDGTHFWIEEPTHSEWSQDREYYSHKFNKAGINYELGISISTQQLIWMNGPFKAGSNDKWVFDNGGLRDKLKELGKKAIGDNGYRGNVETVSFPNPQDPRPVKKFKSRALNRHETFNGLIKHFKSLDGRFRHGPVKLGICIEAVCVICQYQIEHNNPLFDVLIDDVLKEDESSDEESERNDYDGDHDDDDEDEDEDEAGDERDANDSRSDGAAAAAAAAGGGGDDDDDDDDDDVDVDVDGGAYPN